MTSNSVPGVSREALYRLRKTPIFLRSYTIFHVTGSSPPIPS